MKRLTLPILALLIVLVGCDTVYRNVIAPEVEEAGTCLTKECCDDREKELEAETGNEWRCKWRRLDCDCEETLPPEDDDDDDDGDDDD